MGLSQQQQQRLRRTWGMSAAAAATKLLLSLLVLAQELRPCGCSWQGDLRAGDATVMNPTGNADATAGMTRAAS